MINYTELTVEVLTVAFAFNKLATININGYDVEFEYVVNADGGLFECVANDTASIEMYMSGKRDLVMSHARSVLREYMMVLFGDNVFDDDYDDYTDKFDECELHYMAANGTTEVL